MNASLPSPAYASLRAVVRPAIVAHEVLRRQREQAAPLVDEARQVLVRTEDLLQKIGLARAYEGDPIRAVTDVEHGGQVEKLTAAYANAGMAWAEFAALIVLFVSSLIDHGDFQRASRIADFLEEIDERALGLELRQRIEAAIASKEERYREAAEKQRRDALAITGHVSVVSVQQLAPAISSLQAAIQHFAIDSTLCQALKTVVASTAIALYGDVIADVFTHHGYSSSNAAYQANITECPHLFELYRLYSECKDTGTAKVNGLMVLDRLSALLADVTLQTHKH